MSDEDRQEKWQSTTWAEVEAVVDDRGYRAGFVEVFLEFRGAVLDDVPLDARGRPEVVNQSNFARHFGIAVSTFHRWLGEHAPPEAGFGPKEPRKAAEAKARQSAKAARRDRDALAQEVRRKVAEGAEDYRLKAEVRRSDSNFFWIDAQTLLEWEGPPAQKAAAVDEWLELLDEEAEALARFRDELLAERSRLDLDGLEGDTAA